MDTEYKFAALYKKFIDDLIEENNESDEPNKNAEFKNLLIKKRAIAQHNLLVEKSIFEKYEKEINDQKSQLVSQLELLQRIGRLPIDVKRLIGSYSPHVKNQKSLVRIEFYINWFMINKARIVKLLKNWSKAELGFVLNNIRSPNNPYYNCCWKGSQDYKKSYALIFRSLIEKLIEEKGQRSSMEQYSLLLAIEKYDKWK